MKPNRQGEIDSRTRANLSRLENDRIDLPCLAFIHIPKTAGTSVTSVLQRAYGTRMFPAMTTLDYRDCDDSRLHEYRCFKGHAYRSDYQRLPAGTLRFTILREPVRRALSYYNYYRSLDELEIDNEFIREACHLAKTTTPIEFIYSDSPFVIEHLRLGQVRQFLPAGTLAAVAHRQFLTRDLRHRVALEFAEEMENFNFVLTSECLALSFPLMASRLGLPPICHSLPRQNVSETISQVDPADLRRALIDVNATEFDCYDLVRQREVAWLAAELAPCLNASPREAKLEVVP